MTPYVHNTDPFTCSPQDEPHAPTLSVHCQSNFPTRKAASTLDVGLPDGTNDGGYMAMLSDIVPGVLQVVHFLFVFNATLFSPTPPTPQVVMCCFKSYMAMLSDVEPGVLQGVNSLFVFNATHFFLLRLLPHKS